MPNGLTFNGTHSDDMDVVMRSPNRQLLPASRDEYEYVTGRDGSHLFPESLPDRFIEVEMSIKSSALTATRQKARSIAQWLRTASRKELTFDDEPELSYLAKVSNQLDLEPVIKTGRFNVIFRCLPFAQAEITAYDETYLYDDGNQYDSGLIYPNPESFTWDQSYHMSSAYNYGTEEMGLVVEIDGTVTNPKITNSTTGKSITINRTLSNQTLLVDAKNWIVSVDGVNALSDVSGDITELMLATGANGLIFEGTSPNATVTYKWKHEVI